jgi:hypothetical protein
MEEKKFKRTTVTAALPYANGGVHIGHLAGVYVPADIYVRYLRLKKEDVVFIGGATSTACPSPFAPRKRVSRRRMSWTAIIKSSRTASRSSASRSTSIAARPVRRIPSWPVTSSAALRRRQTHRAGERTVLRRGGSPVPRRPLYHGRMSALPQPERLWRPVREVRQRPESYGTHQSPQHHQRLQACHQEDQELVSAPEPISGLAEEVDSGRSQRSGAPTSTDSARAGSTWICSHAP